jgi:hypothetical protein
VASSSSIAGSLFDPDRQRKIESYGRRIGYIASIGVALLFALIFWFVAGLWWLTLGLLIGISLLMAGTTWLVTRNPTPTVTCLNCSGRGWIEDLKEHNGDCPKCAAQLFSYYRFRGQQPALMEDKVAGAELVARRRDHGSPWI